MQNAVLGFSPHKSENIHKHRKESSFRRQLSLIDLDSGSAIATVRFYGNGSRAYCCAWFGRESDHARGSGWAGGYGYHKDSAAMEYALDDAGWKFAEPLGGTGETSETGALEAIAAYLGIDRFLIMEAHP